MPKRRARAEGESTKPAGNDDGKHNVQIPDEVHARWSKLCAENGWKSKVIVGKLIDWYSSTHPIVRSAVLSAPEGMESAYAEALRKIADDLEGRRPIGEISPESIGRFKRLGAPASGPGTPPTPHEQSDTEGQRSSRSGKPK